MIGIALGQFCLAPFQAIARAEVAQINLPVAVLIWLMIIPMLMKIDFAALAQVKRALARHRGCCSGQAVLDGAARLAVHRLALPPVPACRARSTATSPA
jgi:hypothetical protein